MPSNRIINEIIFLLSSKFWGVYTAKVSDIVLLMIMHSLS